MSGTKGRKPRTAPVKFMPGWLKAQDQRYLAARRAIDGLGELAETLGGADVLTPQQKSLCERVVWLNLRLQQMEAEFLAEKGLDAGEYTTLIGSLTSIYRLLGIHRQAKRVPRALDYAASVTAKDITP